MPDVLTVLAIGAVVYVLASVIHEAIGHGLTCVLVGGDWLGVSSSWCRCDVQGPASRRIVSAMGSFANLVAGIGFLWGLGRARTGNIAAFCWLSAGVNLLQGGGYMMVDPLFGFGDWRTVLDGLSPHWIWKVGVSLAGAAISLLTFFVLLRRFEPLAGQGERARKRRGRILCWLPYLAIGGGLMVGSALMNASELRYAVTSALSTLGGTFLLIWIPVALGGPGTTPLSEVLTVRREPEWLLAGLVCALLSLFVLGPGIWF